jgi:hypothetical protein
MAIAPQDILAQAINSAYEANLGRPADLSGMTHYLGEIASGNKTVDQVIADLEYAGQQFSQPGQAEYIAPDAVYYEAPDVSQQQYIDTRIQQSNNRNHKKLSKRLSRLLANQVLKTELRTLQVNSKICTAW